MNRLHVLFRDLHHGGADQGLTTEAAARLLRTIRPLTTVDSQPKTIGRDLLGDLRRPDAAITRMDKEVRDPVAASGSTLTQIHGLGAITAGKISGPHRRRPTLPKPGALRQLHRHRPDRCLQRRTRASPTLPKW